MKKGLISKIQHYSTKDGPGLRTTVFLMGCNLKCLWCANPENLKFYQRIFYFKERCHQCGLCVQHAHNHSIQFQKVECYIDREKCDNLIEMVDICPFDAYEKIGMEMTSEELVNRLIRDQEFYQIGEGGVTFSGGEAALQADFIYEVASHLQEKAIHVCLDTAGYIEHNTLSHLLEKVNLVLYDIKSMDNETHIKCTGVSNHLILDNAKMIAKKGIPMIVRLVVVPQFNDDIEDMKARIDFIYSLGSCVQQVDILRYHIYGAGKYERLGLIYPISQKLELDDNRINELYQYAIDKGLKVTIGG